MRIPCPFCGERDLVEFVYQGDANQRRASPDLRGGADELYEAVYLRANPAGPHAEWWYHAHGCRCWIRVTRDTRTHEILAAELAHEPRSL